MLGLQFSYRIEREPRIFGNLLKRQHSVKQHILGNLYPFLYSFLFPHILDHLAHLAHSFRMFFQVSGAVRQQFEIHIRSIGTVKVVQPVITKSGLPVIMRRTISARGMLSLKRQRMKSSSIGLKLRSRSKNLYSQADKAVVK
ncbi:MAG: hypothetical protein K2O45_11920 [Oscillospiraceae bacterium]|nr:hypothetical protein [Oscillospiraceae bacterium]